MKGFKDTTKMVKGHHFKADGGSIVAPMGGSPGMPVRVGGYGTRPIMPRPHVMPNVKMQTLRPPPGLGGHQPMSRMPATRLAAGGVIRKEDRTAPNDGGGGPYHGDTEGYGSATEKRSAKHAYSSIGREYPDNAKLRPNYRKGGMHINPQHKGKFTRAMGKKPGHLTDSDVQRGLHSRSGTVRKEANFARMARRKFKPLAKGGSMRQVARQEVGRHVATPPPRGHGVKAGNLAFMREPMFKRGGKC